MRLTNILQKASKSKLVLVQLRSTGSSHKIRALRERNDDKKECIRFDPFIGMECVYKEEKKLKSIKHNIILTKSYNEDTYGIIPPELLAYDVPEKEPSKNKK